MIIENAGLVKVITRKEKYYAQIPDELFKTIVNKPLVGVSLPSMSLYAKSINKTALIDKIVPADTRSTRE
jgi:hypothetical protein